MLGILLAFALNYFSNPQDWRLSQIGQHYLILGRFSQQNKGFALLDKCEYDEAIKAYDKAIELDPNHGSARYGKGIALAKLGRTTEADLAYKKAKEAGL